MFDERLNRPASRWISVIFLHGHDAEEMLRLIARSGPGAVIEYLQHWDYGDETTDAALTNGYVYDRIPAGSTDQTVEDDGLPYALTYSAPFRYVSLLRRYPAEPEPEPVVAASRVSATQPAGARSSADTWVTAQNRSTNKAGHAVAL
jgi:hypothetical protein